MHPQTFHIILRSPLTQRPLMFYMHAASSDAALAWVESTFAGIDTAPTHQRWAAPPDTLPRVGNSDPVRVTNVDHYSTAVRRGGKLTYERTPEGQNRRSAEQVHESLSRALQLLKEDRIELKQSFTRRKALLVREWNDAEYERLVSTKAKWERSKAWEHNLTLLVTTHEDANDLVLPERPTIPA